MPFGTTGEILCSEIKKGREVTHPGNSRPIFEFWLDVPHSLPIRPGDSVAIFPKNRDDLVDHLIEQQGWTDRADNLFKIEFLEGCKKKIQFIPKEGCTIRRALIECIDLDKPPSKLFLLSLLNYCQDAETNTAVRAFCSKEMKAIYTKEIMEKRISIARFLIDLNIQIPFKVLVENASRLLPRPYSIISGSTNVPGRIRLAFSWNSEQPGLMTTMLRKYIIEEIKSPIHFYLRHPSDFRLNVQDEQHDLILIGPGLGVIPFLGIIDELKQTDSNSPKLERFLYTSWRNKGVDDVFLKELTQTETISHLSYAYTRDNNNSEPKVYVQDLILRSKKDVGPLLASSNTKIFICGEGMIMIPQIELSLIKCLSEHLQLPEEAAKEKLKEFKQQKRIVIEQWF